MTMREFIRQNRTDLDAMIVHGCGENCRPTNDSEREQWVMNDESLYQWAKDEGVPV